MPGIIASHDRPGAPMSNTRPADPETDRTVAADLEEVRLGQARLLHQRTRTSCLTVEAVILYLTRLLKP